MEEQDGGGTAGMIELGYIVTLRWQAMIQTVIGSIEVRRDITQTELYSRLMHHAGSRSAVPLGVPLEVLYMNYEVQKTPLDIYDPRPGGREHTRCLRGCCGDEKGSR